ncbi:MAG: hypothetical protein V7749_01190 [Cocleimonas sp.]
MYSLYLKLLITCLFLSSCSIGVTHLNTPVKKIDKRQQIEDGRYLKDRTFSLTDIAPVINAYVALPFPKCDIHALKTNSDRGTLKANLSVPSEQRVYKLDGDIKCIL